MSQFAVIKIPPVSLRDTGGASQLQPMQFAVIKTGGKQYLVEPGTVLKIEKLDAKEGGDFSFSEVLLVGNGDKVEIGTPTVQGARVEGRVLKQGRARKIIVFKYHAKTRYRKKKGHRQPFTEIKIEKIIA